MKKKTDFPVLQVALDFLNLDRAMKAAREAANGGADYLEAGTPLIKSEGMEAVRTLRAEFPDHVIVADLKTLDAGRTEMEAAAKAGADIAVVMACASDSTIRECVETGKNYGIEVAADLLGVSDPPQAAKRCEDLGVHHVGVHLAIDEQMSGGDPFETLREIRGAVQIPVAVAGGINAETAPQAVGAGADIVIVGGAVCKSADAAEATRSLKKAMKTGLGKKSSGLYKRVTAADVREILEKVSTANISDGSHRKPAVTGLQSLVPGSRMIGQAVTVRTLPGDWAKPVEAIDAAAEGDVVVIDAGGVGPATWGELATNSAVQKKLSEVVVHGAAPDLAVGDVSEPMGFASDPTASEPEIFYYLLMVAEKAEAREINEDSLQVLKATALDDWLLVEIQTHEVEWNFDSEIYAWINWQLTKE